MYTTSHIVHHVRYTVQSVVSDRPRQSCEGPLGSRNMNKPVCCLDVCLRHGPLCVSRTAWIDGIFCDAADLWADWGRAFVLYIIMAQHYYAVIDLTI